MRLGENKNNLKKSKVSSLKTVWWCCRKQVRGHSMKRKTIQYAVVQYMVVKKKVRKMSNMLMLNQVAGVR